VRLPANERESDVACFRTPPRRVLPRAVFGLQGVTKYHRSLEELFIYCQNNKSDYNNLTDVYCTCAAHRLESFGGCTLRAMSDRCSSQALSNVTYRLSIGRDPLLLTNNCLHYDNYWLSPLTLNFDPLVVAKGNNSRTEIVIGFEMKSEKGWELQPPHRRNGWTYIFSHGLNYLLQTIRLRFQTITSEGTLHT